jgi:uncharacterized protein (TIGR00369 family)
MANLDMNAVRTLLETGVPFAKKTGALVDELSPTKVRLKLPLDPTNMSPMGTVHAGALFTVAETAAAAIGITALGPTVMFIAKSVEVKFRRPARGDVFAVAQLTPLDAQRMVDAAHKDGKTDAVISVEVLDVGGEVVTTAAVTFSVRRLG